MTQECFDTLEGQGRIDDKEFYAVIDNTKIDDEPTEGSSNAVASGGVFSEIQTAKQEAIEVATAYTASVSEDLEEHITEFDTRVADCEDQIKSIEDIYGVQHNEFEELKDRFDAHQGDYKTEVTTITSNLDAISASLIQKQDVLKIGVNLDNTPKEGSEKPVTSGGVYSKIEEAIANIGGGSMKKEVLEGNEEITLELESNVQYYCETPLASLTLQGFSEGKENEVEQWSIIFTLTEPGQVAVPDTIQWFMATPVWNIGTTYWLSFIRYKENNYLGIWSRLDYEQKSV